MPLSQWVVVDEETQRSVDELEDEVLVASKLSELGGKRTRLLWWLILSCDSKQKRHLQKGDVVVLQEGPIENVVAVNGRFWEEHSSRSKGKPRLVNFKADERWVVIAEPSGQDIVYNAAHKNYYLRFRVQRDREGESRQCMLVQEDDGSPHFPFAAATCFRSSTALIRPLPPCNRTGTSSGGVLRIETWS